MMPKLTVEGVEAKLGRLLSEAEKSLLEATNGCIAQRDSILEKQRAAVDGGRHEEAHLCQKLADRQEEMAKGLSAWIDEP
jgi:hypothetical protein